MYPPLDIVFAWLAGLAVIFLWATRKDPPDDGDGQLTLFDMDAIDCQGRRFHVRAWEDVA